MTRFALFLAVALLAGLLLTTPPALAQTNDDGPEQAEPTVRPVVIREVDSPLGRSIPLPGSGTAPTGPGDRGGSQQLLLLGLIITFFAVAVGSVTRSARRANL